MAKSKISWIRNQQEDEMRNEEIVAVCGRIRTRISYLRRNG